MICNHYLLFRLSEKLDNTLRNCTLLNVFSQEKGKIVFHFVTQEGKKIFSEISVLKNSESFIVKENFAKAKKNYADVFKELFGAVVSSVSIISSERAFRINFIGNKYLLFVFIPGKSNVHFLSDNIIISSFKSSVKYVGKICETVFEKSSYSSESSVCVEDFINSKFPLLGKIYREELMCRMGVNAKDKISNEFIDSAITKFNFFEKELLKSENYFIYKIGDKFIPSLIRLESFKGIEPLEFYDLFSMLNSLVSYSVSDKGFFVLKNKLLNDILSEKKKTEKKINNLELNLSEALDFKKYKKIGDLLLGNIGLDYNDSSFLVDKETGLKYDVKLDKTISISENASHYYNKYKKLKEAVILLREKISKLNIYLNSLVVKHNLIENTVDYKSLKKMEKENTKKSQELSLPFRIFKLDDYFEVWVGKNSSSNDLLTMKYAKQYELWFHVRGASGSHTVLKFNDKNLKPPKEIIYKSAAIAAYYSKARNSGNVPVAYCERKYVRKFKGLNEGAVVMEREKVIFVKPAVPE